MNVRRSMLLLLLSIASCTADKTSEIDKHMRRYDDLILRLDVDAIVNTYRPEGRIRGENQAPIVGRDSIRKFLGAFQGVKIFDYRSASVSTIFRGDTAIQEGSYFQKVQPPKSDTLELGGQYQATWIRGDDSQWLILEMYTHDYRNLKKR